MNIEYLMEYLSRQLHTRVHIFSMDGGCVDSVCMRKDLEQTVDGRLFVQLRNAASESHPVIA